MMDTPMVRPGLVQGTEPKRRVVAFFRNGAGGNLAIQMVTQLGVPADRLGVTTPDQIEHGQGMILSIACPDDAFVTKVEALCRRYGADVHRQKVSRDRT